MVIARQAAVGGQAERDRQQDDDQNSSQMSHSEFEDQALIAAPTHGPRQSAGSKRA